MKLKRTVQIIGILVNYYDTDKNIREQAVNISGLVVTHVENTGALKCFLNHIETKET